MNIYMRNNESLNIDIGSEFEELKIDLRDIEEVEWTELGW